MYISNLFPKVIHLFFQLRFFLANIHAMKLIGKKCLNILGELTLDGIHFLDNIPYFFFHTCIQKKEANHLLFCSFFDILGDLKNIYCVILVNKSKAVVYRNLFSDTFIKSYFGKTFMTIIELSEINP